MLTISFLLTQIYALPWKLYIPPKAHNPYSETIDVDDWLIEKNFSQAEIPTVDADFLTQCKRTIAYLENHPYTPLGMLSTLGYSREKRLLALQKIVSTASINPTSLQKIEWWKQNFQLFSLQAQSPNQQTRITKYLVYQVAGSTQKTDQYNHALWNLKEEFHPKILHQHSRIDILDGVLETQKHVQPLVWLTEKAALEAQMQGTIEITTEKGSIGLYNVQYHNNMPYKKGVSATQQERYWYFRKVEEFYGWGDPEKIAILPDVSFAGDVQNLGFGSMLWVTSEKKDALGLLVDTGGAFSPNLNQFDWFIGTARDKQHFYQRAKAYPSYADVHFLILR